jgi:hypothetical protein
MPEAQQQRRTIMGETRDTDWIEAVERERRAKREAIAAALIPLLRIYGDGALPEAFYATVEEATGFRGDNHSSGGTLRISFVTTESGTACSMERGRRPPYVPATVSREPTRMLTAERVSIGSVRTATSLPGKIYNVPRMKRCRRRHAKP